MRKRVKIFRWRVPGIQSNNFGDELTIPILDQLFGIEAILSRMDEAQLIGAGSILDSWALRPRGFRSRILELLPRRRSSDLHVWGSGFILPNSQASWPQKLHFHAVRGSLTAERIGCRPVFGDPGILASMILSRRGPKEHSVGLVPHYSDVERVRTTMALPKRWTLVDPHDPVDEVLSGIASCELIVSSSLHGLIVADSFGIPCVWARTEQPLYGSSDFKFADYVSSRRAPFNQPIDYEVAVRGDLESLAQLATVPARSIAKWQQELIDAFPSDL